MARLWVGFLLAVPIVFSAAAAAAEPLQELRVRWDAHPGAAAPEIAPEAAPPPADLFNLLDRRKLTGAMPRQRNPELSADQLVAMTVNAAGEVIDRYLVPDPRVLRAEAPSATGELSGQTLYRTTPEFGLTIPDDPAIAAVRFYKPRWVGTTWVFDLLGTLPLH